MGPRLANVQSKITKILISSTAGKEVFGSLVRLLLLLLSVKWVPLLVEMRGQESEPLSVCGLQVLLLGKQSGEEYGVRHTCRNQRLNENLVCRKAVSARCQARQSGRCCSWESRRSSGGKKNKVKT